MTSTNTRVGFAGLRKQAFRVRDLPSNLNLRINLEEGENLVAIISKLLSPFGVFSPDNFRRGGSILVVEIVRSKGVYDLDAPKIIPSL